MSHYRPAFGKHCNKDDRGRPGRCGSGLILTRSSPRHKKIKPRTKNQVSVPDPTIIKEIVSDPNLKEYDGDRQKTEFRSDRIKLKAFILHFIILHILSYCIIALAKGSRKRFFFFYRVDEWISAWPPIIDSFFCGF